MLKLQNVLLKISKRFTIGPIDLSIDKGKHVALIGESGCGKTSLLKMIYGLYDLGVGTISWNGQAITGPKDNLIPGMPFTKYLSQDFDLMPFTSVEENINKYLSRLQPEASLQRTEELMEVVEMTAYAKVKVKTLSGGQKQRVALAQTLAKEPELLLLDEPFSHIDNFRKNKLRRRLFTYLKKQHITCIVATHDSTDVLAYMDETVVMKKGAIIARNETQKLYNEPPSYYVGSLFGDINELPKSWFYGHASDSELCRVYPSQLKLMESGIEVIINQSFFHGSHWVIEGKREGLLIYFNNCNPIKRGVMVRINLAL